MSTEAIEFSARDFREDSLSRKSSGAEVTRESLEALRVAYLEEHLELDMTLEQPESAT